MAFFWEIDLHGKLSIPGEKVARAKGDSEEPRFARGRGKVGMRVSPLRKVSLHLVNEGGIQKRKAAWKEG